MGRKLWILSGDKKLYRWASKAFSAKILVVRIPFDDIPPITRPTLILLGCDYQCQYELCSRKFLIPMQFPDVPYRFARTILLRNPSLSSRSYLLSPPEFLWSNPPEENTEESRQSEKTFHMMLNSRHPDFIIRLQQEIIDGRGRVFRTSDLAKRVDLSASRLSMRFREESGISLKCFVNKIRLCHSLWELILTNKAIKCVAAEFGYKPASFSLKFQSTFGVWPSQVRNRAELLLK